MFKLLGEIIAHSFGLVAVVMVSAVCGVHNNNDNRDSTWSFLWFLYLYAGCYSSLGLIMVYNVIAKGHTQRKQIKINMNTNEYLKEFNYKIGQKTQKKLDKQVRKLAKKGKINYGENISTAE